MRPELFALNPGYAPIANRSLAALESEIMDPFLAVLRAVRPDVRDPFVDTPPVKGAPSNLSSRDASRFAALCGKAHDLAADLFIDHEKPWPDPPGDHERSRLEKAADHFRKALEIDPRSLECHFFISKVHQRLGDLGTAVQVLLDARVLDPYNVYLATELAINAPRMSDIATALEVLQFAVIACPGDAGLWLTCGTTFLRARRPGPARLAYEAAAALSPGSPVGPGLARYALAVATGVRTLPETDEELFLDMVGFVETTPDSPGGG
jgi:tetratricopeptide (TPR) repeat protein